jgi:hypothetical protein
MWKSGSRFSIEDVLPAKPIIRQEGIKLQNCGVLSIFLPSRLIQHAAFPHLVISEELLCSMIGAFQGFIPSLGRPSISSLIRSFSTPTSTNAAPPLICLPIETRKSQMHPKLA